MLQLMLANGMRVAIDPETVSAVEENSDTTAAEKGCAIVWSGGHRFVTCVAFEAVYNEWISMLEEIEGDGEHVSAAAHSDGEGPLRNSETGGSETGSGTPGSIDNPLPGQG